MQTPIIIQLPKILDQRGNLSFFENNNHLPFTIQRVHWIYDAPGGEEQDRIIRKLSANSYKGGYVSYSQLNCSENLHNLCVWKIEYYSHNKFMRTIWKIINKLISKPLCKMLS